MNVLTPGIKVVGGYVCARAANCGGICLLEDVKCEIQSDFMAGGETVWFLKNELDTQCLSSALWHCLGQM